MTWSLAYQQAPHANDYIHDFMVYFIDTFLDGLAPFSTGAGSDAYNRVINMTYPDVKGGNTTSHLWIEWSGTTSTTAYLYENSRYTTTPGDNGSLQTTNSLGNADAGDIGDWRIWTSDQRSDAFLVTKGKIGKFFWPGVGSAKWNLYNQYAWDGTADNQNTCIAIGMGSTSYIGQANAPSVTNTSSSEFEIVPSVGNYSNGYFAGAYADNLIFEGPSWNYAGTSYGQTPSSASPVQCLPGGASDQGVFIPANAQQIFASVRLADGQLLQSSTNNKYYYAMEDTLTYPFYVLDFGLTEPDFT